MYKFRIIFALVSMCLVALPGVSWAAWEDDVGNTFDTEEDCAEFGNGYCSDIGDNGDDGSYSDDVDSQCAACAASYGCHGCSAYTASYVYECVEDTDGVCRSGDMTGENTSGTDAVASMCQQRCDEYGDFSDYAYVYGDYVYECISCSSPVRLGGSGQDINCDYLTMLQEWNEDNGGLGVNCQGQWTSAIGDIHIDVCGDDTECQQHLLNNWYAYDRVMCRDESLALKCDPVASETSCEYLEIFMVNNPNDYTCEDPEDTRNMASGVCADEYGPETNEAELCIANIVNNCEAYVDAYNMAPTDYLYDIGSELGLSCAGGPSCEYLEVFMLMNPGDYTCSDSADIRNMVSESCEAEYGDSAELCIANIVENCQAYVDAYDAAGSDYIYDIGLEFGLTCGAPTSMTCENCTCNYLEHAYNWGIVVFGSGDSAECDTGTDMGAMCEDYVSQYYEIPEGEDGEGLFGDYASECESHYTENCVAYANAVYSDTSNMEKRESVEDAYAYLGLSCGDACAPGTYNDGASCVECSAGYACAGGDAQPEQCAYTTYAAAGSDSCTACPDPNTHMLTTYPNVWFPVNADGTLNKTSFTVKVSSLQNWGDIGDITTCKISYTITNAAGTLADQGVGFNPSTQKYDVFDTSPAHYRSLNAGWYLSDRYSDTYCNNVSNTQLYSTAHQCPIGSYCPGLTSMPLCSDASHDYASNNTLGLEACPALEGYTAKTDSAGSTSYLQCYLEENKEFTDAKGTYHYTEKCYYED